MRKSRVYRGVLQLNLFHPVPARPAWQTLPPELTQRLRRLLSQLLREHRVGRSGLHGGKGASNE